MRQENVDASKKDGDDCENADDSDGGEDGDGDGNDVVRPPLRASALHRGSARFSLPLYHYYTVSMMCTSTLSNKSLQCTFSTS